MTAGATTGPSIRASGHWAAWFLGMFAGTFVLHELAHILAGLAVLGHWPAESGAASRPPGGVAGAAAGPAASAVLAMAGLLGQRSTGAARPRIGWTCVGLSACLRFVLTWALIVGWLGGSFPRAAFDELHIAQGDLLGVALLLILEITLVLGIGVALTRGIPREERASAWSGMLGAAALGTILLLWFEPIV